MLREAARPVATRRRALSPALLALLVLVAIAVASSTAHAQERWPEVPGVWTAIEGREDTVLALAPGEFVRVLTFPVDTIDEDGDSRPRVQSIRVTGLDYVQRQRVTFWVRTVADSSLWQVVAAQPGPRGSRWIDVPPEADDVAVVLGPEPTAEEAAALSVPSVQGFFREANWPAEYRRVADVLARHRREWQDAADTPAQVDLATGVWLARTLSSAALSSPRWFVPHDVPIDVDGQRRGDEPVPWSPEPVVAGPAGKTAWLTVPEQEGYLRVTIWRSVPRDVNPFRHLPLDTLVTIDGSQHLERRYVNIDSGARATGVMLTDSRTLTYYVGPKALRADSALAAVMGAYAFESGPAGQRVSLTLPGDAQKGATVFVRAQFLTLREHWFGLYPSLSPAEYLRRDTLTDSAALDEFEQAMRLWTLNLGELPSGVGFPPTSPSRGTESGTRVDGATEGDAAPGGSIRGTSGDTAEMAAPRSRAVLNLSLDVARGRLPDDTTTTGVAWRPASLAAWLAATDNAVDRALAVALTWDWWYDEQRTNEFWPRGPTSMRWARDALGPRFRTRTAVSGSQSLSYWDEAAPETLPDGDARYLAVPAIVSAPTTDAGDIRLRDGAIYAAPPPVRDVDGREIGVLFWTIAAEPGLLWLVPADQPRADPATLAAGDGRIPLHVPAGLGRWRLANLPSRFRVELPATCQAFGDASVGFAVELANGDREPGWASPDQWRTPDAQRTLYRRQLVIPIPHEGDPTAIARPLRYAWPAPPPGARMRVSVLPTSPTGFTMPRVGGRDQAARVYLLWTDGTRDALIFWPKVSGDDANGDRVYDPTLSITIRSSAIGVSVTVDASYAEPLGVHVALRRARSEWRDRGVERERQAAIREGSAGVPAGDPAHAATPSDDASDANGDVSDGEGADAEAADGDANGNAANDQTDDQNGDGDSGNADERDGEDTDGNAREWVDGSDGTAGEAPAPLPDAILAITSDAALLHAPADIFRDTSIDELLESLRDLTELMLAYDPVSEEHARVRLARLRVLIALRAQHKSSLEVAWFTARFLPTAGPALPADIVRAVDVYAADLWIDAGYHFRVLSLDPAMQSPPLLLRQLRARARAADLDEVALLCAQLARVDLPDDVRHWIRLLNARARLLTWRPPDPFPHDALNQLDDDQEIRYWHLRRRLAAGDVTAIAGARALASEVGIPPSAATKLEREAGSLELLPVLPLTPDELPIEARYDLARWYETADWWRFSPLRPGVEITQQSGELRLQTVNSHPIGIERWRVGPNEALVATITGPGIVRLRVRGLDPALVAQLTQQARQAVLERIAGLDFALEEDPMALLQATGLTARDLGPAVSWWDNGVEQPSLPLSARSTETLFRTIVYEPGGTRVLIDPVGNREMYLIDLPPGRHTLRFTADIDATVAIERLEPGAAALVRHARVCANFDTFMRWFDGDAVDATEGPRLLPAADRLSYPWPLVSTLADAVRLEPHLLPLRSTLDSVPGVDGLTLAWPELVKAVALPPRDYSSEGWRQIARALGRTSWLRLRNVASSADLVDVVPSTPDSVDRQALVDQALLPPAFRGPTLTMRPGERWIAREFASPLQKIELTAYTAVRDAEAWTLPPARLLVRYQTNLGREDHVYELPPGEVVVIPLPLPQGFDPVLTLELQAGVQVGDARRREDVRVELLIAVHADDEADTIYEFPRTRTQRWPAAIEAQGASWQVPGGSIVRIDAIHELPIELELMVAQIGRDSQRYIVPLDTPAQLVADAQRRPRSSFWFSVPEGGPVTILLRPNGEYGSGGRPLRIPLRCYVATPPSLLVDPTADPFGNGGGAGDEDDDAERRVDPLDRETTSSTRLRNALAAGLSQTLRGADDRIPLSQVHARLPLDISDPDRPIVDTSAYAQPRAEPSGTAPWDLAITFGLSSDQRYEDVDTLSPRDFLGSIQGFLPIREIDLFLNARFDAIITDIPDVLTRVSWRAHWLPLASEAPWWAVEVSGYWLVQFMQERLGLDPGERLFSGILYYRIGVDLEPVRDRVWTARFSAFWFQRILNPENPSSLLQMLLDARVWTQYKRDHLFGAYAEALVLMRPVEDASFGLSARLTFNETFTVDSLRFRFNATQFVMPVFDFEASLTWTHYYRDEHRFNDADQFQVEVEAGTTLWVGGDYWRLVANIGYRFDRSNLLVGFSVEYTFGTGGTFDAYGPQLTRFGTLRRYDPNED